jgi:arylsulfatase
MMRFSKNILILVCVFTCFGEVSAATTKQPNFLVIVADDLGWSDLSVMGGEIRTPNIDRLAKNGVLHTSFRVAPTCSPTRSMLLTGMDNHLVGHGSMALMQAPNQIDSVYYKAELRQDVVTLGEVLQDSGYQTMMAGKWHLGKAEFNLPNNRGFDRSFTLLEGGASHFADVLPLHPGESVTYLENGSEVSLPENFYSSISYTDKFLEYLSVADSTKPFFGYLAYTAPHDPLQVPDDWVSRYEGTYSRGPLLIREARIQKQRELGLLPPQAAISDLVTPPKFLVIGKADWKNRSAEERRQDSKPMEIYAAMIELLDQQVGRVVNALSASGRLNNTYIIFISDNGANAATPLFYPSTSREWLHKHRKQDVESMGRPGSHTFLGREWAAVSSGPLDLFKGIVAEGGIRVPLIATGPDISQGERIDTNSHIMDIMPTLLDLAKVRLEETPMSKDKAAFQGRSLATSWTAGNLSTRGKSSRAHGFELFGNSAIVKGKWKARKILFPLGTSEWELYDLNRDPNETVDLKSEHPEKLNELLSAYEAYESANKIIKPEPAPSRPISSIHTGECSVACKIELAILDSIFAALKWINKIIARFD